MKEKNFIYFTKGTIDETLKQSIVYSVEVVDAEYSPVTNRVQIVYSVSDWETQHTGYLLEEYDPASEKFKEIIDTVIYVVESLAIKKVCLKDFIGCLFSAELTFASGVPEIDWKTAEPEESSISKIGQVRSGDSCSTVIY